MGFFPESLLKKAKPRQSTIPLCGSCGLYKKCASPKMEPSGEGKRGVLFLAEAPGATEDEQGIQLVGNSGRELERVLDGFGVKMRRDCWLTNTLICRPPDNRTPTTKEIGYCLPNLVKTIRDLKPRVIIPLGGTAILGLMSMLFEKPPTTDLTAPAMKWCGCVIPAQAINTWICPTYHPSFLLRIHHPAADNLFRKHLKAAFRLKGRPYKNLPNYKSEIRLLYKPKEVKATIDKMIRRRGWVAIDYETNKLKPDADDREILCCAISWKGQHTIAFPWHPTTAQHVRRLWKSPIGKVAANVKFEDRWTRAVLGTRVRNWVWDTMLGAHQINNGPGVTGLKFQAFTVLGQTPYDDHIKEYLRTKKGATNKAAREVGLSDLLLYCGMDALLEAHLAIHQTEQLELSDVLPR